MVAENLLDQGQLGGLAFLSPEGVVQQGFEGGVGAHAGRFAGAGNGGEFLFEAVTLTMLTRSTAIPLGIRT